MQPSRSDDTRPDADAHLACTIHFWGEREQNRLLVECIEPLARQVREAGLCRHVRFNRFDARGPHVFAVFTAARAAMEELGQLVSASLREYLDTRPSRVELSTEARAARHAACRGRTQSAVDRYPGLADNNTFFVTELDGREDPFSLGPGADGEDELRCFVDDLGMWAISCLARVSTPAATAAAIAWLAMFDRALADAGLSPAAYWRFHAGTLAPELDERMRSGRLDVDALRRVIGVDNRRTLAALWLGAFDKIDTAPHPGRLIDIIMATHRDAEAIWRGLREILHMLLGQMGIRAAAEVPIVLFAWLSHVDQAGGGGA